MNELRGHVYSTLKNLGRYHFSPVNAQVNGRRFPINPVLETLTYVLDANHLLVGDPGFGKTTSAKIVAAQLSGLPYDLYDATEIRGNPHAYEEKIVGRFDFSKLQKDGEVVLWKASHAMPVLIVDEANWIPEDAQAAILQGIATGRWNYGNETIFEGKNPSFSAINKRTDGRNGMIPALMDRMDVCTEFGPFSTADMLDIREADQAVRDKLYREEFTEEAMKQLRTNFTDFRHFIATPPLEGYLTKDQKEQIKQELGSLRWEDDATLFLQAFAAEINWSNKYGWKRSGEPISDDIHDQNHIGSHVENPMSPRPFMAAQNYASALAWFLGDEGVSKDHVKLVLPYTVHHKLKFTDQYRNEKGSQTRTDSESLALAKAVVEEADVHYAKSIDPVKNLIGTLQKGKLSEAKIRDLNPDNFDHPLMKDLIQKLKEPKPFYE